MFRHPASLGRVPSVWFPFVTATIRALRLLADLCFASFPSLCRTVLQRRRRDLPVLQDSRCVRALLSDLGSSPPLVALQQVLPSAFPDGVGLGNFLYAAQSHGPLRSLSTLRLQVAPTAQDSLPAVPSALAGWVSSPQGFVLRFQLIASSSAGGAWRTRKAEGEEGDWFAAAIHPTLDPELPPFRACCEKSLRPTLPPTFHASRLPVKIPRRKETLSSGGQGPTREQS
jgi:hypothetical protein